MYICVYIYIYIYACIKLECSCVPCGRVVGLLALLRVSRPGGSVQECPPGFGQPSSSTLRNFPKHSPRCSPKNAAKILPKTPSTLNNCNSFGKPAGPPQLECGCWMMDVD